MDADEKRILNELVVRAKQGDAEAAAILYERFKDHVFRIGLGRLRNEAEAEDVMQDVFVQVLEKLWQLNEPEAFSGWLKTTACRIAINRATRRKPVVAAEDETLEAVDEDGLDPEIHAMMREDAQHVREGMDRLGALDRKTLEAFYFRGQTLIEMSEEFDAPIGTIKRRLHTARHRLAKEVEPFVAV